MTTVPDTEPSLHQLLGSRLRCLLHRTSRSAASPKPVRKDPSLCPFLRWQNWGPERLWELPQMAQLMCGGAEARSRVAWPWGLSGQTPGPQTGLFQPLSGKLPWTSATAPEACCAGGAASASQWAQDTWCVFLLLLFSCGAGGFGLYVCLFNFYTFSLSPSWSSEQDFVFFLLKTFYVNLLKKCIYVFIKYLFI